MRLIHLSDIHVWHYTWNVRRLLGRRAFRAVELALGRARRFDLLRLEAVVDRVLACGPDHVLITGDLTTMALPIEFQEARRQLEPLLQDPKRVSILPGNHDRTTWYSAHSRRYEMAFGEFMPAADISLAPLAGRLDGDPRPRPDSCADLGEGSPADRTA